jgi:AcrR family transcriptional regulator
MDMADMTRMLSVKDPSSRPERRRNADRSATTRKQILEATIQCLETGGYGAVTNIKVADAAGVSRGAMMHHFPTRQALIVALVEYAHEKLNQIRRAEMEKFAVGLPRFRAIMDLSLVTQRMPEGMALNEIRIGSRSDPEIREVVTPMMSAISEDYVKMVSRIGRDAGLKPTREMLGLIGTVAMTTRALAINTFTYPSPRVSENVLWALRMMREALIEKQLGADKAEPPEPLPEDHPGR